MMICVRILSPETAAAEKEGSEYNGSLPSGHGPVITMMTFARLVVWRRRRMAVKTVLHTVLCMCYKVATGNLANFALEARTVCLR